jgi:regulator of protease activity HflC (stomatin/prohibitin superfamily)
MSRAQENTLIFAGIVSAMAAGLDIYLHQRTGLFVFRALLPFLTLALISSWLTAIRLRLARVAEEERLAQEGARQEQTDQSLFGGEEGVQPFTLARSREQFERIVVPVVAFGLVAGLAFWAFRLFRQMDISVEVSVQNLLGTSFLTGQAFIFFLLSRYLIGIGRVRGLRLCRGPGIHLGLASLLCFVAAVASMMGHWFAEGADHATAKGLLVVLLLLAVEGLFLLLTAIYHPRRKTMIALAMESRIGGLFTDPVSWAERMTSTFVYQTGHGAADNLNRLVRRSLVPTLLLVALTVYLLSGLVILGPHEQGIRERFGKPVGGTGLLDSGIHFTLPRPFETVRRVPAKRIQTIYLGYEPDEGERPAVMVWTQPHYEKEDLVVLATATASTNDIPASLMTFNIPVEYRITNTYDYVYQDQDPARTFHYLAQRALTREMAAFDEAGLREALQLDETVGQVQLLTMGRRLIAEKLKQSIQSQANQLSLGVEVLFVGVQDLHPPTSVAAAYEDVVGSLQARASSQLLAEAYAQTQRPFGAGEAAKIRMESEAYQVARTNEAAAVAARFEHQLKGYEAAPSVFMMRQRLTALERGLADARKYLVDSATAKEVITLNLEEDAALPFLDFDSVEDDSNEK